LASLSQAKILGEVGSILVVLTAVPTVGGLLSIAGFILLLIAVKEISDHVADRSIFNNMLISVGAAIVGVVVATILLIGSLINFFYSNGIMGSNPNFTNIPQGNWVGMIVPILGVLAVVWVALIVSAVFVRRSYSSIASKLDVSMFRTAGLVYLIGAATSIVIVGFFIIFVAQVLLIVAFFSIPEKAAEQMSPPPPPAPIST
jgi:uncharacterized membrane protein